jgi:hypothetical protein
MASKPKEPKVDVWASIEATELEKRVALAILGCDTFKFSYWWPVESEFGPFEPGDVEMDVWAIARAVIAAVPELKYPLLALEMGRSEAFQRAMKG